ncbi:unnamed protein product [Amoebophrya sp. A120]|nr:unnamed protein product [Amoebophrya sp. A120]|eukprot:GSA120T00018468001.1
MKSHRLSFVNEQDESGQKGDCNSTPKIKFPPSAADIASHPEPLAFRYSPGSSLPLASPAPHKRRTAAGSNNSTTGRVAKQTDGQLYRQSAAKLSRLFPHLAWSRPDRPTRINLDSFLGYDNTSLENSARCGTTAVSVIKTPNAANKPSAATHEPCVSVFVDEIKKLQRILNLDVVHADLLLYEQPCLLGWHQDSFDRRRHLCTVVLDLVNDTLTAATEKQYEGTTRSCEENPLFNVPLRRVTTDEETDTGSLERRRRPDGMRNTCLQEWCPIERDTTATTTTGPQLLPSHVRSIPPTANLSIHGVTANNNLAHRFVFRPHTEGACRICLVLFCWSAKLAKEAERQEILIDMSKWWTPSMNEL